MLIYNWWWTPRFLIKFLLYILLWKTFKILLFSHVHFIHILYHFFLRVPHLWCWHSSLHSKVLLWLIKRRWLKLVLCLKHSLLLLLLWWLHFSYYFFYPGIIWCLFEFLNFLFNNFCSIIIFIHGRHSFSFI